MSRRRNKKHTAVEMVEACANSGAAEAAVLVLIRETPDGVSLETGYGCSIAEAEAAAKAILRDVQRHLAEKADHDCIWCQQRLARVTDALAVLDRDNAAAAQAPTGEPVH